MTDLPSAAKVIWTFNEQGRRSERFECHDQMGKMKLGFQVQLDANGLHSILWLPPRTATRPITANNN